MLRALILTSLMMLPIETDRVIPIQEHKPEPSFPVEMIPFPVNSKTPLDVGIDYTYDRDAWRNKWYLIYFIIFFIYFPYWYIYMYRYNKQPTMLKLSTVGSIEVLLIVNDFNFKNMEVL